MKIGLSLLGEHPARQTGVTSLYREFVAHSLRQDPGVSWVVFAGPNQDWPVNDPRVHVVRDFPANDHLGRRLWADHVRVAPTARRLGANVLLSTGFVPFRKCLPTAMHVLSLQHLSRENRVGLARRCYRTFVMKQSWQRADLIITNSRFAVGQILSVYPDLADRLVQSYEGLQHEIFHPTPAPGEWERLQTRLQTGPGYVLWLSNFYPYKQAELLITAYAQLPVELRQKHALVLAGGDWENQVARNQRLVRQLQIEANTRFLGWVPDDLLAPLYRHAAVHCLPSREETFGRTVLEAMACGTPVMVNDIPVMHEVMAGQEIILDFTRTDQVTSNLRRVLTDETLRSRLRQRGLGRAQDFSFARLTAERLAALRNLLKKGSRNP